MLNNNHYRTQIQRELIGVYENDFSKHNGKVNSGRILMVFRSIVAQLAKTNEKFMYGAVREGGRARDFEEAIECSNFYQSFAVIRFHGQQRVNES